MHPNLEMGRSAFGHKRYCCYVYDSIDWAIGNEQMLWFIKVKPAKARDAMPRARASSVKPRMTSRRT